MSKIAATVFAAIQERGEISMMEASAITEKSSKAIRHCLSYYVEKGEIILMRRLVHGPKNITKQNFYKFAKPGIPPELRQQQIVAKKIPEKTGPRHGIPPLWDALRMGALPAKPMPETPRKHQLAWEEAE